MVSVNLSDHLDTIGQEVWALVPARSGSKGIPDKNLQQLQGTSLLGLSVLAGTACPTIDRCFVSTDSQSYADEARQYGAEVPFLRPAEASSDTSTDLEVFLHFLNWASAVGQELPWAIVHLRPTTPCRVPDRVNEVVELARSVRDSATAIRSVNAASESPFKWFLQDNGGYLTTLDGARELDSANRSRAEFPDVYIPNGYADVIYPMRVLSTGLLHGDAVRPFITEPVIEVDGPFDLELLRRAASVPNELLTLAAKCQRGTGDAPERRTEPS